MTKPKLTIPERKQRTPEEQRIHDELMLINSLYIRWVNDQLLPEDDFLLIEHMDHLQHIKQQADWQAKFRMEHLNWKVDQMNLNKPNSEGSN
jgi:hypothetical protein